MAESSHGPGAALFAKDVGTWDAEVIVVPQPGAEPQLSKGVLVARVICGGKWLVTDFKNTTTGFEGHGIYGYNGATGRYTGTWVDDMRSSLVVAEGTWDEASKTMTFAWTTSFPDGRKMSWTETTELVKDGEQIFKTLLPMPNGAPFEMMRAVYRRRPS